MASHRLLDEIDLSAAPRGSAIVEVGSVRESGDDMPSSLYLWKKAEAFGLEFFTVDFSPASWRLAQQYVGSRAVLEEGTAFLSRFDRKIAVLYLDNFDYPSDARHAQELEARCGQVYRDQGQTMTRAESVRVHGQQFQAAVDKMSRQSWLIIDNTYRQPLGLHRIRQPFWGKGQRVVPLALRHGFRIAKEGCSGMMLSRSSQPVLAPERWLQLYCGGGRTAGLYQALGFQPPMMVGGSGSMSSPTVVA